MKIFKRHKDYGFVSMRRDKKKIAKVIWGSFCLFGITLFVEDFYHALNHPEVYPFGAEGPVAGIWYYKTQELYLWDAVILVCWFAVGLLLCLLQHKFRYLKWWITAHCFLTLLYIPLLNRLRDCGCAIFCFIFLQVNDF